jgi:hypothetical protein
VPLRQDASYRFRMTFGDPRPSGVGNLTVHINGFPVAFTLSSEANRFRCEFDIDQGILAKSSGFCRIQVQTGESVSVTPADRRLLGISVRGIEFICLER